MDFAFAHVPACHADSDVVAGFKAVALSFYILQNQGVDVLRGILQDIIDLSLAELNAVEAELGKKDTAGPLVNFQRLRLKSRT